MAFALIAGVLCLMVIVFLLKRLRPSGWQIANLLFFAANVVAVRTIPRLDNARHGLQPLNYFTPAGYAFAIWAVIYLTEKVFVVWQLLLPMQERKSILDKASPWFCAANACQVSWCFAFQPALDTPGLAWIPAVLLSGIALSLNRAHSILALETNWKQGVFMYVPFTIHFGWVSAAALVNWNGYLARCDLAHNVRLVALLFSVALATALGMSLALQRRSALYGATVTWALSALGVQTLSSERIAAAFSKGPLSPSFVGHLERGAAAAVMAVTLTVALQNVLAMQMGKSSSQQGGSVGV